MEMGIIASQKQRTQWLIGSRHAEPCNMALSRLRDENVIEDMYDGGRRGYK
jgi:hypothetical protein